MRPPPRWLRRAPAIREPLRRAYKRHAPEGPLERTVEGLAFSLAPRDNKVDFDIWYKSRLEEAEEREFCAAHLHPGGWFLDIGANIGLYTISALAAVPNTRAVAFEPLERLRARLFTNLRLNDLSARVTVCGEAVGPHGEMVLHESQNAGRSSLIAFAGAKGGRKVPVRPLSALLMEIGVAPTVLKIDVEGFEAEALMPYFDTEPAARWPRAIVIETLHRGEWARQCLGELGAKGYDTVGQTAENALLLRRSPRGSSDP